MNYEQGTSSTAHGAAHHSPAQVGWHQSAGTGHRSGLTRQHIGRIENGELVNVAYVTIQQIAEALGMTVDIIDSALTDLAPLKRMTP